MDEQRINRIIEQEIEARRVEKLRQVMKLVNAAREVYDMQPLVDLSLGVPCDADSCPLAYALPMFDRIDGEDLEFDTLDRAKRVSDVWDSDYNGDCTVQFPDLFAWFIDEFDNGRLPQYALPDPEEEGGEGEEGEEEPEEEVR